MLTCVHCGREYERLYEPHTRRVQRPDLPFARPDASVLCRPCYQALYYQASKEFFQPLRRDAAKRSHEAHKAERTIYIREYKQRLKAMVRGAG